jgi:hypothetical protein
LKSNPLSPFTLGQWNHFLNKPKSAAGASVLTVLFVFLRKQRPSSVFSNVDHLQVTVIAAMKRGGSHRSERSEGNHHGEYIPERSRQRTSFRTSFEDKDGFTPPLAFQDPQVPQSGEAGHAVSFSENKISLSSLPQAKQPKGKGGRPKRSPEVQDSQVSSLRAYSPLFISVSVLVSRLCMPPRCFTAMQTAPQFHANKLRFSRAFFKALLRLQ